ncbi:cyclase family protein [Dactylosporangium sp. McL0621]|uniref:cyclase family protein n=1 Tax=Dactylosporangium sp. McL0621 TaxID=3415678 RepID=UPI003CEADC22
MGLIGETVDLSHPLSPALPHHPDVVPPSVTTVAGFERDGCFAGRWDLDEHSGTHVDAPAHFVAGGAAVHAIAAADLVLLAAVVDIRDRVRGDADARLEVADILDWERRHGPLPGPCAVLALTGWAERIHDRGRYLGLDGEGRPHWPGFAAETARFLAADRPQVYALGIDTPSLDSAAGERAGSAVHHGWLGGRRYGVENLANLERLPPVGGVLIVGVPALVGASGAPARVLGLIPAPGLQPVGESAASSA